ncbi:hypothetical protein QYF61_021853 [Mycteria americana]|uniref:Uncharacterized protein n=1 Tax=Mycteria americana TaxID=33587 RepID=A0AAN7MHV2_MYCAM|nr:hypothetical protein QYF61_021853 [Mycteria americana]
MPKTASNHHITHKSFSVREQEVQRGPSLVGSLTSCVSTHLIWQQLLELHRTVQKQDLALSCQRDQEQAGPAVEARTSQYYSALVEEVKLWVPSMGKVLGWGPHEPPQVQQGQYRLGDEGMERSTAEQDLGHEKLAMRRQCALAAQKAKCLLGSGQARGPCVINALTSRTA